jgi:hypothetical protein
MTEYLWKSPGGTYTVPDEWRQKFLKEFPEYRVRWSLAERCWHLEQAYGRGALPPLRIDEADDSLVRSRDGYWLVMKIQPGDRMACPGVIQKVPRQLCENTIQVPSRRTGEAVCGNCRQKGRDGRTIAGFWPFDETLLDELRRTNPLTHGIVKKDGKTQTRAAWEADQANARMLQERDRIMHDGVTSIDQVDHRWLTGIPSAGFSRRKIDDTTFR